MLGVPPGLSGTLHVNWCYKYSQFSEWSTQWLSTIQRIILVSQLLRWLVKCAQTRQTSFAPYNLATILGSFIYSSTPLLETIGSHNLSTRD